MRNASGWWIRATMTAMVCLAAVAPCEAGWLDREGPWISEVGYHAYSLDDPGTGSPTTMPIHIELSDVTPGDAVSLLVLDATVGSRAGLIRSIINLTPGARQSLIFDGTGAADLPPWLAFNPSPAAVLHPVDDLTLPTAPPFTLLLVEGAVDPSLTGNVRDQAGVLDAAIDAWTFDRNGWAVALFPADPEPITPIDAGSTALRPLNPDDLRPWLEQALLGTPDGNGQLPVSPAYGVSPGLSNPAWQASESPSPTVPEPAVLLPMGLALLSTRGRRCRVGVET